MSYKLTIDEVMKEADKVLELHANMDKTFNLDYSQEHLKMAIAAGIADAYSRGCDTGFEAGKYSVQIG